MFEFLFLYFMIVETKNRSLEETAALFDGEDAMNLITGAGHDIRHDEIDDEKVANAAAYHPMGDLKA